MLEIIVSAAVACGMLLSLVGASLYFFSIGECAIAPRRLAWMCLAVGSPLTIVGAAVIYFTGMS